MISDLVEKAIAGDERAEKELFENLTVRFRYLAKRYMKTEDVEDVTQEACLTILQKYKKQEYAKSFEAWAYGVLKMKIGNYLQNLGTRKKNIADANSEVIERLASGEPKEDNLDLSERLVTCLKKINEKHPRYVRVLNLVHQGYKTEEICEMLDIKPNYFYVILNRGRKMLRECLKESGL
jgi:RNA polymerase sigma factor (sigma-70 family)